MFYVSPDGNDAWSGKLPLRTPKRPTGCGFDAARAAVRRERAAGAVAGKPIVVDVLPGVYDLDAPLLFEAADSGTADSPVVWRGAGIDPTTGEPKTILRAGKTVSGGQPVTDETILRRIKPGVRDKILRFDLSALG